MLPLPTTWKPWTSTAVTYCKTIRAAKCVWLDDDLAAEMNFIQAATGIWPKDLHGEVLIMRIHAIRGIENEDGKLRPLSGWTTT